MIFPALKRRIVGNDPRGQLAGPLQQVGVSRELRVTKLKSPRLSRADQVPHPPLFQIQLRNSKTILRGGERMKPRWRRAVGQQDAVALFGATAHPTTQLVELRQAEAVRVLDH